MGCGGGGAGERRRDTARAGARSPRERPGERPQPRCAALGLCARVPAAPAEASSTHILGALGRWAGAGPGGAASREEAEGVPASPEGAGPRRAHPGTPAGRSCGECGRWRRRGFGEAEWGAASRGVARGGGERERAGRGGTGGGAREGGWVPGGRKKEERNREGDGEKNRPKEKRG